MNSLTVTVLLIVGLVSVNAQGTGCGLCDCDSPGSCMDNEVLYNTAHFCLEGIYQEVPETATCLIAERFADCLELWTGDSGWIVLVGANNLFTSRIEYAARFGIVGRNHARFTFGDKHDFEFFIPIPNTKNITDVMTKADVTKTTRALVNPDTNMKYPRNINFNVLIDKSFDKSNIVYKDSARLIQQGIPSVCSGQFVVINGKDKVLGDESKFCARYVPKDQGEFIASYKKIGGPVSSKAIVFAPQ